MAISQLEETTTLDGPAPTDRVSVGRQMLRRELNDRSSARNGRSSHEFRVFCECGRATCRDGARDGVLIRRDVYEKLRRIPTQFLVKHGHAGEAEHVVDSHAGFLIVDRFGPAGSSSG